MVLAQSWQFPIAEIYKVKEAIVARKEIKDVCAQQCII